MKNSQRPSSRKLDQYEKISIYQLLEENNRAWLIQWQRDGYIRWIPKSQSKLCLSTTGGNNFIYVTKWLIKNKLTPETLDGIGVDASTIPEQPSRGRRGRRGRRPYFEVPDEDLLVTREDLFREDLLEDPLVDADDDGLPF